MLDTVILSRIQFGFTIGFHILFPTLNLGLAIFLLIMEGKWLVSKNPVYLTICRFWTKLFALTFGMGVVSGIVMAYELGTNFGQFTNAVGAVIGPLFGYEVLSAFFLEAGFLGVMLFGWNKVGPKLHFMATLMVAVGTSLSAFWIMSANSWMQTPAGFLQVGDKFIVDSWMHVIFNPAFSIRFTHMILASYVTSSFVVMGISAWYILKDRQIEFASTCLRFAVAAGAIVTAAQIIVGDFQGLEVYHNQPLKTAAIEGIWDTTKGAPFLVFALPDAKQEKNHFAIKIPYLASLINTHSLDGELIGLKTVPAKDRPLVASVFFNFRIMLGLGFLMLFVSFWGLWLRYKKRLTTCRAFLRVALWCTTLGFIATFAGWMTTETGRQPWVVYNLMRTTDGASVVAAKEVLVSLILFIIVYIIMFSFYLVYMKKVIRTGPKIIKESDAQPEERFFLYMHGEEGKPNDN